MFPTGISILSSGQLHQVQRRSKHVRLSVVRRHQPLIQRRAEQHHSRCAVIRARSEERQPSRLAIPGRHFPLGQPRYRGRGLSPLLIPAAKIALIDPPRPPRGTPPDQRHHTQPHPLPAPTGRQEAHRSGADESPADTVRPAAQRRPFSQVGVLKLSGCRIDRRGLG